MGRCLRCGKEFSNPVPEVVNPEGNREIATKEWCPKCNGLAMGIIFRQSSAYKIPKGILWHIKGDRWRKNQDLKFSKVKP